ncbi:4-alpha-glucanotransferase [Dermatobacter hominis]|uniref:4-alpha-glucanotransferase n=1 Tax=Dermatobacter hominis TaxID=2884263 RepID=UPI001D10EE27|nr:4-alpha-glucanotransferase [Dermatobacter hominis]UDY36061.1 4-alpha-glucanotransferase [Dermatobacter hominis]
MAVAQGDSSGRDAFGIADGWWGTDGRWNEADPASRAALRRALGGDEHPDGPPEGPSLWFVRPGDDRSVWSPGLLELDDGAELEVVDALPHDLPLGAHTLTSEGGHVTHVFSVPSRCRAADRSWGFSVQLPQTRSTDSWGHGDLGDLRELARWAADRGAAVLAHNPLGAPIPLESQQPSPYYASTRRFWSPLYLRIEEVPGSELLGEELTSAARAGRELTALRTIDRDSVWALKSAALRAIWERVRHADGTRTLLAAADGDDALRDHARFCALAERYGGGWSSFPAEARHPGLTGAAEATAELADDVERWRWIQLLTAGQLATAAQAGAALMADLPVGFDPDGSDAWIDQDLLALECRIGAPPDDLGPLGQDWGLPPYVPWRLRAAAYGPWIDTLRRIFRHAGLLRIDHAMGLFRLYCIPPGAAALGGAYVYASGTELLDLACMEAARAGAVLLGEDLGTVEPEVREAMGSRGVYGYSVGWFEDDPPASWPSTTVAMLTTHDLPTVAGLWTGADAADRAQAGLPDQPEEDAELRARLERLASIGGLDDPAGAPPDRAGAHAVSVAAHRALAGAGSDLVIATLEDAVGQVPRPNLPGTVDEHPNWRIPLPALVEELDVAGAADLAAGMREQRPDPVPDRPAAG